MIKTLIVIILSFVLVGGEVAFAKSKRSKKSKGARSSKVIKLKKKRRYRRRGNGPDIKKITVESPFIEEPTNGVNPLEKN